MRSAHRQRPCALPMAHVVVPEHCRVCKSGIKEPGHAAFQHALGNLEQLKGSMQTQDSVLAARAQGLQSTFSSQMGTRGDRFIVNMTCVLALGIICVNVCARVCLCLCDTGLCSKVRVATLLCMCTRKSVCVCVLVCERVGVCFCTIQAWHRPSRLGRGASFILSYLAFSRPVHFWSVKMVWFMLFCSPQYCSRMFEQWKTLFWMYYCSDCSQSQWKTLFWMYHCSVWSQSYQSLWEWWLVDCIKLWA